MADHRDRVSQLNNNLQLRVAVTSTAPPFMLTAPEPQPAPKSTPVPQVQPVPNPGNQYGVYFDDGGGYLYISKLGAGTQGEVVLVRSTADGEIYVRKRSLPMMSGQKVSQATPEPVIPEADMLQPNEVRLYRPHPNIPQLIDFRTYEYDTNYGEKFSRHISTWKFCNGGDLYSYIDEHEIFYEPIPEVVIWRFLYSMLKTLRYLHRCNPPICHRDITLNNIFVHFPQVSQDNSGDANKHEDNTETHSLTTPASPPAVLSASSPAASPADFDLYWTWPSQDSGKFPDFYLGDFGYARTATRERPADSERFRKTLADDIHAIKDLVMQMLLGTTDEGAQYSAKYRELNYSQELLDFYSELNTLAGHVQDGNGGTALLEDLCNRIGKAYRRFNNRLVLHWCLPSRTIAPRLFDTEKALLRTMKSVPGPWKIATVDANLDVQDIGTQVHGGIGRIRDSSRAGLQEGPRFEPEKPVPRAFPYI